MEPHYKPSPSQTGASGFLVKGEETPQIVDVIRRCVHDPRAPSRSIDVLPPQLGARSVGNRERRTRLEAMVRGEGIGVVYQPIFDLESGSPVGAEALCRFAGSPLGGSDVWFREAVEQGLGIELEVTAVRHALHGLDQLDPSISLHVNVSPEACCSPKLRGLLEQVPGDRIVLEITENAPVEDYERLEPALTPMRNRGVGLAVDDTCSGFAILRHVLYLRPDTVVRNPCLIPERGPPWGRTPSSADHAYPERQADRVGDRCRGSTDGQHAQTGQDR